MQSQFIFKKWVNPKNEHSKCLIKHKKLCKKKNGIFIKIFKLRKNKNSLILISGLFNWNWNKNEKEIISGKYVIEADSNNVISIMGLFFNQLI